MTILDGHIHINEYLDDYSPFHARLREAGIEGGIVLSLPPESSGEGDPATTPAGRLEGLMRCAAPNPNVYPFFWIDPTCGDAADQVELAIEAGVSGFKVICHDFFPGDPRALSTFRSIAAADKPIMFHSGILWDGTPSSKYNRPVEFEALIDVEGLRFSLAHISWPWCDELIAVYGKFLAAKDRDVELYVDTTPGTPRIYRRDALTKLYTVGYDVEKNVFFGSDCLAPEYNGAWAKEWVARDTSILQELGQPEGSIKDMFSVNLLRFLSGERKPHRRLSPGV